MKQITIAAIFIFTVIVFSYCSSSKKAVASPVVPALTYEADIQSLVVANCSPCHIPAKGGRMRALDNYDAVTINYEAIISRIQLNPGDLGFMPFKGTKLSDSTVNVFKQWKEGGLSAK